MKQVNWNMKKSFVFPAEIGQPVGAENIKVTPRFTAETVKGRPKLTGIYHIAVTVNVTGEKIENYEAGEAIVIDDLDLNDRNGYFEYALPFNIDFPPEAENPVDLKTLDPSFEVHNHQLIIVWEVACTYKEADVEKQPEKEAQGEAGQVKKENDEKIVVEKKTQEAVKEVVSQKEENVGVESKTSSNPNDAKEVVEEKSEQVAGEAPKEEPATPSYTVEDTTFSNSDEVLSFMAGLDDDISTSLFRSNDVTVQTKG